MPKVTRKRIQDGSSPLANETPGPETPGSLSPELSVVVPVFNEAESILPLLEEIKAALKGKHSFEVIFVDDGSGDASPSILAGIAGGDVRALHHKGRRGQSAAVRTGVIAARSPWVATLDGDGQNDPADIPGLLLAARSNSPAPTLVGGVRTRRQDTLSKRLASRFANGLRQFLLQDGATDTGCGIKLFRRDVFLTLPFFGAQHRFLPALFRIHGHPTAFAPVNHRPRQRGVSKYGNLKRGLIGIVDLLGVWWLKLRTPAPTAVEEMPPQAAPPRVLH